MARWFRFYNETLDDPKVQKLSPTLFKHWVNLLCLTARHDGTLPPAVDIAFALRTTDAGVVGILDDLVAAGLLDHDETGLRPHNWRSRQHLSDVSTERVKRFRDRSAKRDETVSVTPPESETETESERTPNPASGEREVFKVEVEKDLRNPRAKGTNPRAIAEARARVLREAAEDEKWRPRLAEFAETRKWQSAWGTVPNPNPAIVETGVLLPRRLWPEAMAIQAQGGLPMPEFLRKRA